LVWRRFGGALGQQAGDERDEHTRNTDIWVCDQVIELAHLAPAFRAPAPSAVCHVNGSLLATFDNCGGRDSARSARSPTFVGDLPGDRPVSIVC
jgi:hypothetical protein